MQFKYQFPEVTDQGPGAGVVQTGSIQASKLSLLRRSQLVWLAKAFGVDVPSDAPKTILLPLMETAQMMGRLGGQPRDRYAYMRAHYNSDNPHPEDHPVFPETVAPAPEPEPVKRVDHAADSEFRQLQQQCKAAGIKCFGMGVAGMREALARLEPLKERANANPDPS
jgi:hypothetical protein